MALITFQRFHPRLSSGINRVNLQNTLRTQPQTTEWPRKILKLALLARHSLSA